MEKLKKGYENPTPLKWRKFATSLRAFGASLSGYAYIQDKPVWILISVGLVVVGETIIDFIGE